MTPSRPTPSASWSSGATRLRGKHSTLRIHSWLPHGALNGSNGWTHNLEGREFANDTALCGLQLNCREQSPEKSNRVTWGIVIVHPPMEGQEVDWKRLVQFALLGSSDLEQYAILLVRVSIGLFFAISGANKLFAAG